MSAPSHRFRNLRFVLAFGGVLAIVAWLVWSSVRAPVVLPPPPAPVQAAQEAAPEVVSLRLLEVDGAAEIREASGPWRPALAGETLAESSALRTLEGRAVLGSGELYEVVLEPGTEVSTQELTHSISRLLLERGMATASVREGRHLFEVGTRGSDAVARTSDGVFTVSNDGKGTVAVATTGGAVELSGAGRVVVVRSGQQSLVLKGSAPTDPAPIPDSVLLRVQWPADTTLRRRRIVIAGESAPGARVLIGEQTVDVGADGRFETEVELREGTNALRVRARDVGGATRESTRDVRVDTTAPKVGLDRDLWGE